MFNEIESPSKDTGMLSEANPTLKERLTRQRKGLQENLDKVDAAIKALEDNPDLENFLNIIGKVSRI